jgi:hypothetical protein
MFYLFFLKYSRKVNISAILIHANNKIRAKEGDIFTIINNKITITQSFSILILPVC